MSKEAKNLNDIEKLGIIVVLGMVLFSLLKVVYFPSTRVLLDNATLEFLSVFGVLMIILLLLIKQFDLK